MISEIGPEGLRHRGRPISVRSDACGRTAEHIAADIRGYREAVA